MVVYMLKTHKPARRGTVHAATRRMTWGILFHGNRYGDTERYGRNNRVSLVCSRKTDDDDWVEM